MREKLEPKGASNESGPQVEVPEDEAPMQPFGIPKPGKRHSHLLSEEELSVSASRLLAGCSKD